MAAFADRLRELREGAGLTQQQLGEQAGMHKLTVAKLEHGIREPTWATVQALATALGVGCEVFTSPPAEGALPSKPRGRGRPKKQPTEAKPAARPQQPDPPAAKGKGRKRKGE